ncbi:MAG: ABC transporter permease [Spirochaetaceae bacterium]|nr:MAG: ABC transporter permease [Spirochaetaceae bacterium]
MKFTLLPKLSPLAKRRIANFRANKRAFFSLIALLVIFLLSLCSEIIANDKPILLFHKGGVYFPIVVSYPETTFGGEFATEADYRDPFVASLLNKNGWAIWPPVRFSHETINKGLNRPFPAPPSLENPLGTDDSGRDVLAQVIYGIRLSLLFGLLLTIVSPVIGILVGAIMGYFGGFIDIFFQRVLEIYESIPQLFLLIIITSIIAPGFWLLFFILAIFEWTSFVGLVRAEFLRARNFDYVRAAGALGVGHIKIMFRHILPNALTSTLTFIPFILSGSVLTLAILDLLGFGLPPSEPSLGRILAQGQHNLQAPWLSLTGFFAIAILLSLMVFIGEGLRDAFDTKKTFR